jgi:hypothetical protein
MGEPLSERDDGRESGRSGLHQDDSPFSALLAQVGGAPPTATGSWAGVGADAAGSWPRGGHGVSPFGGVEWPGAGRGVPSASGAPLAGTGWYGGPWPRPGAASCPPPWTSSWSGAPPATISLPSSSSGAPLATCVTSSTIDNPWQQFNATATALFGPNWREKIPVEYDRVEIRSTAPSRGG